MLFGIWVLEFGIFQMGDAYIINIGREAIFLVLMVSAPVLIASLVIGVVISIIQAVTQIQDMTITFVPKFFLMGLILLVTGGWMMNLIMDFTIRSISSISSFTH